MKDTQLDAWADMQPHLSESQAVVRGSIWTKTNGATLFELQSALGWPINRISGRVTELSKSRMIVDSGLRRVNPNSGKRGIVWVVAPYDTHSIDKIS